MNRRIRISESGSNLRVTCELLDDVAPRSAEFLWQLANTKSTFDASHAIWTGPEISCPLPASVLPDGLATMEIPEENATSFPDPGELVLASIPAGTVKGLPPGNFYDLGIFYGPGGRLLMPFGWIKANVCARIVPAEFEQAKACIKTIRQNGDCKLSISPVE